jgi:hypothetical protein
MLFVYTWNRSSPPPQPEVGCTPANLQAAARLATPKEFHERLAQLLKEGRQARMRPGISLREVVEEDRRDCRAVIALLESRATPLSAAAKETLRELCLAWDEGYEHILTAIDSAGDNPDRLRELQQQAERDAEQLQKRLGELAYQTSN